MSDPAPLNRQWWKEAVVYQIYPRSFYDGRGDGTGDLSGIIEKLDYLDDLGIDVVWLSPVYDSPMADNGYDIRDYRAIADLFGTMDDFDTLLAGLHDRGMRLVMDLVVNHTSDEHRWFKASRSAKDSRYRNHYIWRPPAPDGGPPSNWRSFFGGPAWTRDEATGEYYLHLFAGKQPDLNWEKPEVRAAVYDDMRFWLDKGVDGFRMDVITFISKNLDFPDLPAEADPFRFYANGPRLHEFLQEMHREVLQHYDVMTVGESWGVRPEEALAFVAPEREELHTFFQFDHVQLTRQPNRHDLPREWTLPELKAVIRRWDEAFAEAGWGSQFLGNHDLPRMVSQWGDDRPAFREASAKLWLTFLLTMRGTPYVYQGDEIGLPNPGFTSIEEFRDIEALGTYRARVDAGEDPEAVLEDLRHLSRDNARVPIPWTSGPTGGFTTADEAWIPFHPDRHTINVEAARNDPDSVWHYLRAILALRHQHDVLVYGDYQDLAPKHERLWLFARTLGEETVLVALNASDALLHVEPPGEVRLETLTVWMSTHERMPRSGGLVLQPYEAMVLGVEEPRVSSDTTL
jgi:oligo-1,6-glucosidase